MRITDEEFEYAVRIRRLLHQHPETGFDLPETCEIVKTELESMGIEPIPGYAPCSYAAYIGRDTGRTLGIRADMDALPIEEQSGVEFSSTHPGKMHACGHDSHTAVLLCAAKYLKAHENELPRRIKLIFQPSEECEVSGARKMAENGVLDDVDTIICTHCDNTIPTHTVGVCPGNYMAACCPITLVFHGKSAHAELPRHGIDAVQMAVQSYMLIKEKAKELSGGKPYIFSMGLINGGTAHNVIADKCVEKITFRWYDYDFASKLRKEALAIMAGVCSEIGGTVDVDWEMSAPPSINDLDIAARLKDICTGSGINYIQLPSRMSSEDFGWFLKERPGAIFRFGTGNPDKGCTTVAHTSTFKIDEDGIRDAVEMFINAAFNL